MRNIKEKRHHIWCNYFRLADVSKCRMCARLNKEYPMGNMTEDELLLKYFPNVVKRS